MKLRRYPTAERKTLARKSSILKALGSLPGLSRRQIAPARVFIFRAPLRGEGAVKSLGSSSGDRAGTSREFPQNSENFFF
jgi:hypothetical protein